MKKILHISLATLLPLGYTWADTVSNFSNPKNSVCKPFTVSETTTIAASFTTGSFAGGYQLSEVFWSIVTVNLSAGFGIHTGGKFTVQLWASDPLGNPAVPALEVLSGPSTAVFAGGTLKPGVTGYQSSGTFLNPNTTYWVSASVVGGTDLRVRLEQTNLPNETSNPAGWSIGNYSMKAYSDSTVIDPPEIVKDEACLPYLKITAVPVPEPSTVALLGLTGAGLLLLARRRK